VTVTVIASGGLGNHVLGGLDTTETQKLKACLGSADFDLSTNGEVYDWDYGSLTYPHLVKLVLTTASYKDGGYYVALYYSGGLFKLLNNFVSPNAKIGFTATDADMFDVYTTKGTLVLASANHGVNVDFGSNSFNTVNAAAAYTPLNGDISCEINQDNAGKRELWTRNAPDAMTTCLNKTSIFTFLSSGSPANNPAHINLYTVQKIYQKQFSLDSGNVNDFAETFTIETDLSSNWGVESGLTLATPDTAFQVYKFFPASESSYTYVSQCSNRGLCNHDSGLCECFHGYTGDACSDQNSLAV